MTQEPMRDIFNGPRPAEPQGPAAPTQNMTAEAAERLRAQMAAARAGPLPIESGPPMQVTPAVDYNLIGQMMGQVLANYDDVQQQRKAEERENDRRMRKHEEELAKQAQDEKQAGEYRLAQQRANTPTPSKSEVPVNKVSVNQAPTNKTNDEVQQEWDAQDKLASQRVVGAVAPALPQDSKYGPLDKEAVAIVTSVITVIAIALPWVGITVTAEQITMFTTGILSLISAVTLVAGVIGGVIMRSKVNSKATADKLIKRTLKGSDRGQ